MSKRYLSDLIKERLAERQVKAIAETNGRSQIYFTDLSPLTQEEVDLFWEYPGSALERAIALRLATRSAEEAVMAAMAWDASKRKPCHLCGERLHLCKCITYCSWCGKGKSFTKIHTCAGPSGSIWDMIASAKGV